MFENTPTALLNRMPVERMKKFLSKMELQSKKEFPLCQLVSCWSAKKYLTAFSVYQVPHWSLPIASLVPRFVLNESLLLLYIPRLGHPPMPHGFLHPRDARLSDD